MNAYEWIDVPHRECGGQGCGYCNNGEITVRINTSEEQAA